MFSAYQRSSAVQVSSSGRHSTGNSWYWNHSSHSVSAERNEGRDGELEE